ncbi:hypothetical protein QE152_g8273 [Popillia japonica]|uniref:Uncharacterized protein n=1 Tax=Popillia japonica TaxID=7064 RepID=A0AAW1MCC1_POPJA
MPPSLRSNGEKCDEVIAFLKSEEYAETLREMVGDAVQKEVSYLHSVINELRNEIATLKESNIDMIRLYSNSTEHNINNIKSMEIIKNTDKEIHPTQEKVTTRPLFSSI